MTWLKQKIQLPDGPETEGYELVTIRYPDGGTIVQAVELGVAAPRPDIEPIYTENNERLVFLPGGSIQVIGKES